MDNNYSAFSAFSAPHFKCKLCDIACSKKNDWTRHLLTRKHIANANGQQMDEIIPQKKLTCKCGRKYANKSSLCKHSKKCNIADTKDDTIQAILSDNEQFKKLMMEMVISNTELQKQQYEMHKQQSELQKQNSELQKQVLEVCKNTSNININQTNSHNKTFNMQFFLNEQCKDAMNISDFVDSFDLQLSDLESVGDLGYVEGMTKIFLDKLNTMDIYKRPIHCSDTKREILYVKDEDKWEKEKRSNPKLRDAIKHLSFKNMKLTNLWSNTYPESKNNESRLNDVYMKLVLQSTGGSGEIVESENKIIRRIAKEVFIDKTHL